MIHRTSRSMTINHCSVNWKCQLFSILKLMGSFSKFWKMIKDWTDSCAGWSSEGTMCLAPNCSLTRSWRKNLRQSLGSYGSMYWVGRIKKRHTFLMLTSSSKRMNRLRRRNSTLDPIMKWWAFLTKPYPMGIWITSWRGVWSTRFSKWIVSQTKSKCIETTRRTTSSWSLKSLNLWDTFNRGPSSPRLSTGWTISSKSRRIPLSSCTAWSSWTRTATPTIFF